VNEAMARLIWGTDDAIGRTVETNDSGSWEQVTIVGIAANARLIALDRPVEPYIYVPLAQRHTARVALVIKTEGRSAIPEARSVLRQMNPNLPVTEAMPMREVTALGLIPQRIAGAVAGSLGIVGLLLAAIGIYGATSYSVARRVREIGIRLALGADRRTVLRMVLRQGLVLTLTGVGIGLAAGAAAAQIIRSLLFGVSALDPIAFGVGAALFVAVALLASIGPARRATRVDPMAALRAE
jgi:hypothetical protein